MSGRIGLRKASGDLEINVLRNSQEMLFIHEAMGCLCATRDDCHDPLTNGRRSHRVAKPNNCSRKFETRHIDRRSGRCWVETASLENVGAIETRRGHGNEHFGWTRDWIGPLFDPKITIVDNYRTHRASLGWEPNAIAV